MVQIFTHNYNLVNNIVVNLISYRKYLSEDKQCPFPHFVLIYITNNTITSMREEILLHELGFSQSAATERFLSHSFQHALPFTRYRYT